MTADDIRERFPALDLHALLAEGVPEREWVVDRLLPASTSVSLVGPAGSRKSLLALALALDVSSGRARFAGLAIPRRRRVLYVDTELNRQDIAERLVSLGVTTSSDLSGLVYLHLPPLPPLDTFEGGATLHDLIDGYGLGRGDVVVLDSTQRVVTGKENDADTWRAYYRHTAARLKWLGMTVIRTDNTGKDVERGGRGSNSKRDEVDIEWSVAAAGDRVTLTPAKHRLSDVEPVHLRVLDDERGTRFTVSGDPFHALVQDVVAALDALGLPDDVGQRPATEALREAGKAFTRAHIRAAVADRKVRVRVRRDTTAHPLNGERANDSRRTTAHGHAARAEVQVNG